MFKYLLIFIFTFFGTKLYSDPFTNEIGLIGEPETIEEVNTEEIVDTESIVEDEIDTAELNAEDLFDNTEEEISSVEEIVEKTTDDVTEEETQIITVLNIDPIVAYSLKDYTLKGTALSKESKVKFKRAKIKKFDHAQTPTTHTIEKNDTIEKIAFKYGFPLREIELANALYPGSRKLVVGNKLVIPNRFHIVKEGQTLSSIADRYNINPIQLASYNDVTDENVLLIGDKLLLPFFIHVTDLNETMSEIAGRYEREVAELIEFNKLDEKTLVLNENQLIKIPIYANQNIDYQNLEKKSINDFEIDKKNLAIVQINSGQYMVREGDRIGNKDGVIVSIESTRMIVLEDNIEYEFLINTPIVGQAIASLPQTTTEAIGEGIMETIDEAIGNDQPKENNNDENTNAETITNVEDLFN